MWKRKLLLKDRHERVDVNPQHEAQKDRGGLKAHGRVKACSRKPALVVNLYCKLGISGDQTRHIYEPVLGLSKLTGVTRVYKGTTRRRFKDNRQQLET